MGAVRTAVAVSMARAARVRRWPAPASPPRGGRDRDDAAGTGGGRTRDTPDCHSARGRPVEHPSSTRATPLHQCTTSGRAVNPAAADKPGEHDPARWEKGPRPGNVASTWQQRHTRGTTPNVAKDQPGRNPLLSWPFWLCPRQIRTRGTRFRKEVRGALPYPRRVSGRRAGTLADAAVRPR